MHNFGERLTCDFTFEKYFELCHALIDKSDIYPVFEFLTHKPQGPITVLRHDVDRKIKNSLKMAQMEYDLGIHSSYYFRYPYTFQPHLIKEIENLGHEVGYHYEVLSKSNGDFEKAITLFQFELNQFRNISDIKTICMHGSPLSKYNNLDLWNLYDYRSFGILGEAFLSFEQNDVTYLSDTGRSWNGTYSLRDIIKSSMTLKNSSLNNTDDLLKWLGKNNKTLYLTVHPERWSSNLSEWVISSCLDFGMNQGKRVLGVIR